jgi:hypothetical protein
MLAFGKNFFESGMVFKLYYSKIRREKQSAVLME